jgi:hypothetical protein
MLTIFIFNILLYVYNYKHGECVKLGGICGKFNVTEISSSENDY